jgi:hypothetical protein
MAAAEPPVTSTSTGSGGSSPGARVPREVRLGVLAVALPLYIAVVLTTNYIGALHAPSPHDVKVAIVGGPSRTAMLAHELAVKPPGGFTVSQLATPARARALVASRKLAGAYIPSERGAPVVVVATAASPSLATFVEATFRAVAATTQDRPLAVDDLRPQPNGDTSGSPNFFFVVLCTLAGFLTVVTVGALTPALPEVKRLGLVALSSVLAPAIAYLIAGPGYGVFPGSFGTILAMIGIGALSSLVVAVITRLMQLGLGIAGAILGSLVMIFLNFPSAGGSVAGPLLPGFWRFLNHFWLGAAALDANRSVLYFGGAGVGTDVLKLLAWVAACAALLAVPICLRASRRKPPDPRHAGSPAPV